MSTKKTAVQQLLAKRKPHTVTIRLLLDGDLVAEMEETRRQLARALAVDKAEQKFVSVAPELQRRLLELGVQAEDASTAFTFQAMPRLAFEELKRQHPPTEEQWERYRERVAAAYWVPAPEFEDAKFAPALMAACCVEPQMSAADGQELWDDLSDGEAAALYAAALSVNEQATNRPFSGTGTDTTLNSGPDLTTPQNGASPSLSSVEGS